MNKKIKHKSKKKSIVVPTPRTNELVKELNNLKSHTLQYPCEVQLRQLCEQLEVELIILQQKHLQLKTIVRAYLTP